MTNKPELSLLSLWLKAIPIKEARFRYAPAPLMAQLAENPAQSTTEFVQTFAANFANPHNIPLEERMAPLKVLQARHAKHFEVMKGVHRNFWTLLTEGRLRCLAFEAPRMASAEPIEVSSALMEYYPDWEKGIYKHNGLHLIELRVIEAEQQNLAEAEEQPALAGRPSFKAEVLEAFTALQAEGRFKAKPLTHGIAQIRAWIKANRPESRAAQGLLGDDTIRNAIKPLLVLDKVEKL